MAHPRWTQAHFTAQLQEPLDWQFWLARAVARHTCAQGLADLRALERTVRGLWRAQQSRDGRAEPEEGSRELRGKQTQALLDRWAGPPLPNDPAAALQGVRFLPWPDWPGRLQGPRAEMAFWQQDAQGRFIGAAHRLQKLWGGAP